MGATARGRQLLTLFTLAAGSCPGIDTCRLCELRRFIRCGLTTTKCQTNSLSSKPRAPACLILSPFSHILQSGSLLGSAGDAIPQRPVSHAASGAHGCSIVVRQRAGCAFPMRLFPSHVLNKPAHNSGQFCHNFSEAWTLLVKQRCGMQDASLSPKVQSKSPTQWHAVAKQTFFLKTWSESVDLFLSRPS